MTREEDVERTYQALLRPGDDEVGRGWTRQLAEKLVDQRRRTERCPTCFKRVVAEIVWRTPYFNISPADWDNWLSRDQAARHARDGVCPWCGRATTTPMRTLLARFEPNLQRYDRGID